MENPAMKIHWFAGEVRLKNLSLKPNQVVQVGGYLYRYTFDAKAGEHLLSPMN